MSNLLKIPINQKLSGEVEISGAKNAILPILAASLLSDEEIILKNVPDLSDVHVKLKLLENLGSKSHFDPKTKTIIIFRKNKNDINPFQIDHDESKKIRTSTLLMGPLLSRWSICRIFEDGGGCNLGKRALDLHIKFLKILNSEEFYDDSRKSYFLKSKSSRLKGNEKDIDFENRISVGATQNLIMAGVLAEGKTIIRGAASEPEIINLCEFLKKMGAKISGFGTRIIEIEGVKELFGCEFEIMSDRIETGSYLICALMNRAEILIKNSSKKQDFSYFVDVLRKTGAEFEFYGENMILVKKRKERPKPISIETAPHPLFPTDLQQIYSLYMSIANGKSFIKENLFENRYGSSLDFSEKMSANIKLKENTLEINGVSKLLINHNQENPMNSFDLRGGMSLISSGFFFEIENQKDDHIFIKNYEFVKRGYENFIEKFNKIGGKIFEI